MAFKCSIFLVECQWHLAAFLVGMGGFLRGVPGGDLECGSVVRAY